MNKNLLICTIFFSITLSVVCCLNKRSTLELVHVLFRHGDRTPDRHYLYPNDPYINETFYPVGNGQLTNAGKRKEYFLGKFLRKRYGRSFLTNFTLDKVDARSTSYNRTKMSLELVLASLFPPEGDQVWTEGFRWQPVPFNYWPINEDLVIGDPILACPKYIQHYNEYMNSTEVRKLYEPYSDHIDIITMKAGEEMNAKKLAELYFTLTTEKENGLAFPDWAKNFYPILKEFAIMDYNTSTATDSLKRLSSGYLVQKIINDAELKAKGQLGPKIFLYSAHEFNLAFLMNYLDIYYPHIPPYGSSMIIEIHRIKDKQYLKIFYESTLEGKLKLMKLPKCSSMCPLEKFSKIFKPLLPQSPSECKI